MRLSDVFSGSKHKEAPPAAAGPAADDLDALTDPVPGQDVPVATPSADPVPEPKPREASYRYYFRILGGGEKAKIEDYDFNRDGTLTVGKLPDGYELLDQYWIEEGRTLVYIALNKKTNQTEYLLFEPPLSDFEYELLERIHEDLLDVLILTGDEIRKDRREILLNKALALLEDYGLRLDRIALFKLEYYLVRNFLGWSRIDALMVNTNLGLLSYEIRRIKRDMDWGVNFTEALMRFEERVSTPAIARTVTLITKASEMSGEIGEVLAIAASDAKMSETLKKERLAEMFIYTAIVYLSFFVFLFVVAVLSTQFLPVLANISVTGVSSAGSLSGIGSVPIRAFDRLLYHACVIQALFSGLIAGQMGEASLSSGVKHSCVLLIITLVTFNFVLVV